MNITAGEEVDVKHLIFVLKRNLNDNYMGMANIRIAPEIIGHERTGRNLLVIELIENEKVETICLSKIGEKDITRIERPSWVKSLFGGKK